MPIKDELQLFFDSVMKKSPAHNRNRILYYYGFQDGEYHTVRETYDAYKNPKDKTDAKNKQAGPAGVIKSFNKKLKKAPPIALLDCANILQQHNLISSHSYFRLLRNANLVENGFANVRGILSLLHEINLCRDFKIYGHDLKDLTQSYSKTAVHYQNTFLIRTSYLDKLSDGLDYAERLPGDIGLARRTYLIDKFPKDNTFVDQILELIEANDQNIVFKAENDVYYYVEKGKNTLIYKLGKIFNVTQEVEINELSYVLHHSFAKRGKIDPIKYPSAEVIREFIQKYKDTTLNNDIVTYQGAINELTPIEEDLATFFKSHSSVKKPLLRKYLQEKRVGEDGTDKYGDARLEDIYSLAILYKQGRRPNYTFSLVGNLNLGPITEDAANGGSDSIQKLRKKRKTSEKEMNNAQNKANAAGKKGEILINQYLKEQEKKRLISKFTWDSSDDVYSPHDFTILELDGSITHIDVKSTDYEFSNAIHVSYGELLKMSSSEKYLIYRVYKLQSQPRLRISRNLKDFSNNLFESVKILPLGTALDNFSIFPRTCQTIVFDDDDIILPS